MPLNEVMGTGRFDFERASQAAGWIKELQGEHVPETEEYGIGSFVYRAREPFDAERLWWLLHDEEVWEGVLRSKGFFWIAPHHAFAYQWSQAGGVSEWSVAGHWWAAVPRKHWGHPDGDRPDQQEDWHPRYGDRRQELVFIGQRLDRAKLTARLDACLVGDDVARQTSDAWSRLPCPFPTPRVAD